MASPYKGRFKDCGSCEGRGEYPCTVCRGGSVDCERCGGDDMEVCTECEARDVRARQWQERTGVRAIKGGKA